VCAEEIELMDGEIAGEIVAGREDGLFI